MIRFLLFLSIGLCFGPGTSLAEISNAKKIEILKKRLEERPDNKEIAQQIGKLYYQENNLNRAAYFMQKAIDEKDPRSYLRVAKIYRQQEKYLDEIRILNLMIPKHPNYPYGYVLLGDALLKIDKKDEAIVKYRKAIEINPKNEDAYWGLFKVYDEKDNNYESRIILLDLIKYFGDKPKYLNPLCRLYSVDSFFKDSIAFCQRAIKKDRTHPDNHIYLALTYKYAKNNQQAEKIIKAAAKQFQGSEFAQETAGQIMFDIENWERSMRYYQQCTKINKGNLNCQLGLAKAAFSIGQYKISNEAFLKACLIDRKTITEFKKSAAILRINKKSNWFKEFTNNIGKCY
tara:strand:+ start:1977 stop:3008 length:1032 start_codon:yes stop_codon:yes gene_type:complete